jgi:hypothetical protein
MMIDFNVVSCQTSSQSKVFGLCDDPPPAKNPAYIDEADGKKWIAVVENEEKHFVTFTGIDNCEHIVLKRDDGKMAKRCDGMLTYNKTVIFVELKQRNEPGSDWVKEAEPQLKVTIFHFEKTEMAENFIVKKAYIANRLRPKFRESQQVRMNEFKKSTGYVLRIENRIRLD